MDDYPYASLGADGWLRCDGLHRPGAPTLLRDVLRRVGYTESPSYRGRPYREMGRGRCEVRVDIPPHPSDPSLTAWSTTATGVDLDDTLERAAHKALTEFYEHQRLRLEESDHQVSAKDRLIERVQKGNRDLLQENHRLEVRLKQANDELMRTYRSRDFKTDLLDDARTRLQHAQDELTAAQSYVHHLETELHERDDQLEASQAQV